jgi:hypothetical protein
MFTTESESNSMVKKIVEKHDWGYVKLVTYYLKVVTAVFVPVYEERGSGLWTKFVFIIKFEGLNLLL